VKGDRLISREEPVQVFTAEIRPVEVFKAGSGGGGLLRWDQSALAASIDVSAVKFKLSQTEADCGDNKGIRLEYLAGKQVWRIWRRGDPPTWRANLYGFLRTGAKWRGR
jgi:hypothetical protein